LPVTLPGTYRSEPGAGFVTVWRIICCLLLLLTTPLQADDEQPRVVTIGVVADNEPYTFIEGRNPAGFSVDVLRKVAENANLNFDFRAGSWPKIYAAFMDGELDAIDGISWRPDRAESVLFTEPYHIREIYLMRDNARDLPAIRSLNDLSGLRVGVVEDIFYGKALQDAGLTVASYDSLPSLVRALAFGWIDVAVGPRLTLEYLANQAGFRFLQILGPAPLDQFAAEDFRIGVHRDNPELQKRIQNGLKAIPDQYLRDLLERWQEFGGVPSGSREGLQLGAAQQHYLNSLGPVRVGFMNDYAPFSFYDNGQSLGLSVDIMNRLVDLTGLQIIPVKGPWDELIKLFQDGDVDVLANMSYHPDRERFTRFTEPYHTIPNVIFTRHDDLAYQSLEDLKGYRVGLGAGIYYEDIIRKALGADQIRAFTTQLPMFQALARGDVDVVIGALHSGNYWARQLGITDIEIAGELQLPGFSGEDLRFGVRPSLSPLADILNQALARISPTEQQLIETRWLGITNRDEKNPEPPSLKWNEPETQWLANRNREVRICVDRDWMPLEGTRDGQHVGLSADILSLFSQRSGIQFRLVETRNWPQSMAAARERQCDMLPMAMATPERRAFMDFTTPYLEVPNVVIGRIETPFIQRLTEIGDAPIGVVEGYALAELLQQRNPTLNLVTVPSEEAGLRRLQNRELAGYISTLATASYYMQLLGLADLKVIGRVPADLSLAIATRNDEPTLQGIMQKLVNSLTAEERSEFESSWRTLTVKMPTDYTLALQLLAIGLLATAFLVYWNRKLGRLNRKLAEANAALSSLSVTDSLTQLGNRSYFDQEFSHSFQWCLRQQAGFAVAMVDADHFKKINDNFGHEAGDQCLKALARVMSEHFRRDTDRLARFGGEEFVIFASYRDDADIRKRLEQFRQTIAFERCSTCNENSINLTVSIGLALGIPSPGHTPGEYLRLADQALYAAKRNGRNRMEVVFVQPSSEHTTTK